MSADALFDLDPAAQVRMDDLAEDLSADQRRPRRKADRLACELSETAQRLAEAAESGVPDPGAARAAYRLIDQLTNLAWPAMPTGLR